MFFILAESNDGGETWEDDFETIFQTGPEAVAEQKRRAEQIRSRIEYYKSGGYGLPWGHNRKWRVRKVVDTDNDNFYAREAAKNLVAVDFAYNYPPPAYALPHFHPNDSKKVRYFRTVEDAVECRYTEQNLSRFLVAWLGHEPEEVEEYLVSKGYYDGEYAFVISQDPKEIAFAYEEGPTSCMADPEEYPLPDPHPATVYAGPDLGVAFIKRGGGVSARAVVWPEKKIFARIYGHEKLLRDELEKAGYTERLTNSTAWRGARLLKIYDDSEGAYIMPYVDLGQSLSASRCGKYFRVSHDGRGAWGSKNTDGYTRLHEDCW